MNVLMSIIIPFYNEVSTIISGVYIYLEYLKCRHLFCGYASRVGGQYNALNIYSACALDVPSAGNITHLICQVREKLRTGCAKCGKTYALRVAVKCADDIRTEWVH